jgi:hypothetical protein
MSGKQLVRLVVIFAVLLLVWGAAALARRGGGSDARGDALGLPTIDRARVDTVVVIKHGDTTVLARQDSTTWLVNGYRAGHGSVSDLLVALSDTSRRSELVAEQKASQAALGTDSSGARARIVAGGKTVAELVAGRQSSDYSGGYVRKADNEATYLVRGRLAELLNQSPEAWRDHRIAAVPADSIGKIEVSHGARGYSLERADKHWKLSRGTADSARAAELAGAFRDVQATGFATPAEAKSANFTRPDRAVALLRKDGTPIVKLLFDSTKAGFWVRTDTGNTVYRVEEYTGDQLAPADSALRGGR